LKRLLRRSGQSLDEAPERRAAFVGLVTSAKQSVNCKFIAVAFAQVQRAFTIATCSTLVSRRALAMNNAHVKPGRERSLTACRPVAVDQRFRSGSNSNVWSHWFSGGRRRGIVL
jgi:hypothetical protein